MTARRFAYGISVLGFGIGRGSNSGSTYRDSLAVRFSTVNRSLSDGSKIDRIYVDSLWGGDGNSSESILTTAPQVRSLRVEPFEGSGQFGSLDARIAIDPNQNGTLSSKYKGKSPSEHFADFMMGSKPKPWGRIWYSSLDSYIQDIDVNVNATVGDIYAEMYRNRTSVSVGDILYWGREALMVGAVTQNARDSSPQAAYPGVTHTLQLYRGACGSRQETHKLSDYDDVEVYTRNRVLKGRDAQVWRLNLNTNEETLIWEGILGTVSAEDSMGFVELSGNGSIAWSGELRPGWKRAYWSFDQSQRDNVSGAIRSVHVRNEAILPLETSGNADMVVVRGDSVQPIRLSYSQDRAGGLYRYEVIGTISPIMGTYSDREKEEKTDAQAPPMKEVLVGDKRYTHFYDLDNDTYYLHPFDVIRCLLCSTGTRKPGEAYGKNGVYDVLPPGWGLGFPDSRVDHDGITALKGTPGTGHWYLFGLEMTNLLIGNQDETFLQVFERILKPLMCFFSLTTDAKLTIRHLADTGPDSVIAEYTVDNFCSRPRQTGMVYEPRTDVKYKVGRRGASGEYGGEIIATNIRKAEGSAYRSIATDEEIDALDYGDPSVASGSFDDTTSGKALQALCALRYDMLNMAYQEWEFRIQDLENNLVPGSVVGVTHRAMFNPSDGGRGVTSTRCMVTEQTVEPGTFEQTCTMINIGHGLEGVKRLAPSWRISDRTSDSSFTLTNLDSYSSPRSAMAVGMRVSICDPDGENLQISYGDRVVSAYDSGTGVVTLASAFSATVYIGQYLMLSSYGTVEAGDTENLKYCYLSDLDGKLTDSDSNLVAGHQWGQ